MLGEISQWQKTNIKYAGALVSIQKCVIYSCDLMAILALVYNPVEMRSQYFLLVVYFGECALNP